MTYIIDRIIRTLVKEQIDRGEHKQYHPDRYDFRWNKDCTEVTIVPLNWWDDASYLAYQTRGLEDPDWHSIEVWGTEDGCNIQCPKTTIALNNDETIPEQCKVCRETLAQI